jgi:predicted aspartyl protease
VRITILVGLILGVSGQAFAQECPSSLPEFLQEKGYAEVELSENTTKHFEVEAVLNGESLLLIVDTGASHTLFSRDRLQALGLDLEETRIEFSGIGKKQRLYSTEVDDLLIGGASTGPISILAADLGHFREMLRDSGSRAADGLLGADFLARWSAILEVKHSRLYLRLK